uniref:Arabinogalactan peptide 22 n=1 Tax=Oryza brachyantha TaxID=4533 RepID=J3L1I2_ORYBR
LSNLKLKVHVLLSTLFFFFFFSGLMQLSMAQGSPAAPTTATARVAIDAKAVDQAVAYLLMVAALFVTYLAH